MRNGTKKPMTIEAVNLYKKQENEIIYSESIGTYDYYVDVYPNVANLICRNEVEKEFCEVINGNERVNCYFDVEFYTVAEENQLCTDFILYLQNYFKASQIVVLKASRFDNDVKYIEKFKNSFHIHIKNEVFTNMSSLKQFIQKELLGKFLNSCHPIQIKSPTVEEKMDVIDMTVYKEEGKMQKFRMENSPKKFKKNSRFKLISNHETTDTFITLIRTKNLSKHNPIQQMKNTPIVKMPIEKKMIKKVVKREVKDVIQEIENPEELKFTQKPIQKPNYVEIKEILEKLPSKYYEDRELWRDIGFILGSLDVECSDLYHIFSSKSAKYEFKEAEKILKTSNGNLTLETLYNSSFTINFERVFSLQKFFHIFFKFFSLHILHIFDYFFSIGQLLFIFIFLIIVLRFQIKFSQKLNKYSNLELKNTKKEIRK